MRYPLLAVLIVIAAAALLSSAASPAHQDSAPPPEKPLYNQITLEDTYITMTDGVRLAVTLYKPVGAKPSDKFPAILEYLPYRKDDWAASRDYALHSYFVKRGYISARVDIRGTGDRKSVV